MKYVSCEAVQASIRQQELIEHGTTQHQHLINCQDCIRFQVEEMDIATTRELSAMVLGLNPLAGLYGSRDVDPTVAPPMETIADLVGICARDKYERSPFAPGARSARNRSDTLVQEVRAPGTTRRRAGKRRIA